MDEPVRDIIIHFQPEIPQIIVAKKKEDSNATVEILNVIKGRDTFYIMERLIHQEVEKKPSEFTLIADEMARDKRYCNEIIEKYRTMCDLMASRLTTDYHSTDWVVNHYEEEAIKILRDKKLRRK